MCYLVAKDRNAHGCFALKTTHGKHLVELKRELNREVGYKGVQLVTISRPTAYGEYAPYHFVDHLVFFHRVKRCEFPLCQNSESVSERLIQKNRYHQ